MKRFLLIGVVMAIVMAADLPFAGAQIVAQQAPADTNQAPVVAAQPVPVPQVMPAAENAKLAVEVKKQSDSIIPTVTVNQPGGKSIFTLKPYGYIKLDASYDTTRVQNGDIPFYVLPKQNGVNDNEFNMTAKETRLGLELMGADIGEIKVGGKVETDFYGPSGTANSPNLRMRLAYLDVIDEDIVSLRAGQDWDTFIIVLPRTLNLGVLEDMGALGFRRPQLRLSRGISFAANTKLIFKVAAARTIGADLDGGGQDDGADTGYPAVQGSVCLETRLLTDKTTKIGISGHWGRETLDSVSTNGAVIEADQNYYNSYSIIGSIVVPVMSWVSVQGTVWQGEDLTTYYGGIGQGINTKLKTSIAAKGGWAQIMIDMTKQLNWNLGCGLDYPDAADLNANNRSKNQILFTSLYLTMKPVTFAVEYSNITTSYKDADKAADNRIQGSVIYTF